MMLRKNSDVTIHLIYTQLWRQQLKRSGGIVSDLLFFCKTITIMLLFIRLRGWAVVITKYEKKQAILFDFHLLSHEDDYNFAYQLEAALMEKGKILFVDDEEEALLLLKRVFFDDDNIEIFTAPGGEEGLRVLESADIDLVVTNLRMSKMSGNEFLKIVKDRYPEVLRMILTGYSDISSAIKAINKGEVYRYLSKPWVDEDLKATIYNALEYINMKSIIKSQNKELKVLNTKLEDKVKERTAQLEKALNRVKDLAGTLKNNFNEIVSLLTDVVSLLQKNLGAHSRRVVELTELLCDEMALKNDEREKIIYSAFFHDIGLVGANEELFTRDIDQLDSDSREIYLQHPVIGEKILGSVKTLGRIAGIIRSHHEEYNGTGFPDGLRGKQISPGARIIKLTSDFDNLVYKKGKSKEEAIEIINNESAKLYDPAFAGAFVRILEKSTGGLHGSYSRVAVNNLKPGMHLEDDISLKNGLMFVPSGVTVTKKMIQKINKFSSMLQLDYEVGIRF